MKRILPGLLSILLLAACKKDVDELPGATQTGANTFGAKINGTMWTPQAFGPFGTNILEANRAGDRYVIKARNLASSPNETELHLTIYNVTGTGIYQLNSDVIHPNGTASYGYYVKRNMSPTNEYLTSSVYTGSVNVTKLDTIAKIISGTFEFQAGDIIATGTIQVTEGRFDVKYQ